MPVPCRCTRGEPCTSHFASAVMFVVDIRGKRYLPIRAIDEHDAMSRVAAYRVACRAATGNAVDYKVRAVEHGEQLPPVTILF